MNRIKRNGSTHKWRGIRRAVLQRDNHTCYYCGLPQATHVDHITPISKDGTDEFSNLISACKNCNLSKGTKTPEQFQEDRATKLIKQHKKGGFFEQDKTSPTPATFISPKGLKTPFQKPEQDILDA